MNIALFTSVYFNNIGNGFIDLGAEMALKEASPESAGIVKVSQCANFAASLGKLFILRENRFFSWLWENLMSRFANKLHDRTYNGTVKTLDVFNVPKLFKYDYFIIPGCVLTVPFFTIYGKLLEEIQDAGAKLIFLGASGNYYTDYEIKYVTDYLKKLKPYAIIARDSVAYEKYSNLAVHSYNGIDNVFFVNKLKLPKLQSNLKPYIVLNFELDIHKEIYKTLKQKFKGYNIIETNHKPFPYTQISKLVKKGVMISDYPLDYLILYRNAETVYSDRVHACIPTLSFGNKAVLYSQSARKALFHNVGIDELTDEPMKIKDLDKLQNQQIAFLRGILK